MYILQKKSATSVDHEDSTTVDIQNLNTAIYIHILNNTGESTWQGFSSQYINSYKGIIYVPQVNLVYMVAMFLSEKSHIFIFGE